MADNARFARYVRSDELHLGFNFRLLRAAVRRRRDPQARSRTRWPPSAIGTRRRPGPCPTTTSPAPVTRYGGGAVGLARARAMALVELALPGAVYLYNGEELGLPDVDLPDEALQDPVWERSGHTERGRDGCRVPMPWEGDAPPFGFTAGRHVAADAAGVAR